jgi:hypothetical protein
MGKAYNEEQTMGVSPYMGKGMKTAYFVFMALPHQTHDVSEKTCTILQPLALELNAWWELQKTRTK